METKYLPPFADLDWDNIAEINGTSYFYCSSRGCCTTGVICSYRCANVKKCRVVADYINKAREKEAMFDE
jgi:hypothetical protein